MTARNVDLCTLLWPAESLSSSLLAAPLWLVGWNPRGLVVVTAALIPAPTYAEANEILHRRKESISALTTSAVHDTIADVSTVSLQSVNSLRILGRVRCVSVPSAVMSGAQAEPDASARVVRQQADIWLELTFEHDAKLKSPKNISLVELYCCSYKVQQFHLHLITFPSSKKITMQQTPAALTVLSHYGMKGVKRIVGGKERPEGIPGSCSVFEGMFLPRHVSNIVRSQTSHTGAEMLQAAGASVTSAGGVSNLSVTSIAAAIQTQDSKLTGSESGSAHVTPQQSPIKGARDTTAQGTPQSKQLAPLIVNDSFDKDVIQNVAAAQVAATVSQKKKEAVIYPGIPPRIDFPAVTDVTELSCFLYLANSGNHLREYLLGGPLPSPQQESKKSAAPPAAKKSRIPQAILWFALRLLAIVTLAARISYVFRMLEYRLREVINWFALVTHQTDRCGLHPLLPHLCESSKGTQTDDGVLVRSASKKTSHRVICTTSFVVKVVTDVALGMLFCASLFVFREQITSSIRSVAWFGLHDLHANYFAWFQGWPAGFKMNDDLNQAISSFHQMVLFSWREVVTKHAIDWITFGFKSLVFIAPCGASFALCFVADCCNVVTQHLRMMFHAMSLLYRGFRALLGCLIAQFQGKKYNPLRRRTDSFEFDMDQMLLGTLLCTAMVFLFPTVALYYFYLALVRTSVWVVQEALLGCAFLCSNVPLYQLCYWLLYRNATSSGLVLVGTRVRCGSSCAIVDATPQSPVTPSATPQAVVVETTCQMRPMSLQTALFDARVTLWAVQESFALHKLFRFIVLADNSKKPFVNAHNAIFPHLCLHPEDPIAA